MTIFEQNPGSGQNLWANLNFHPWHVSSGQKWQFLAKSCIGQINIFGKIEIFRLDTSVVVKNDNFEQNPWCCHLWIFLEKLQFLSTTCLRWSRMTILRKILDRANIFEKVKIFIIDMSAVVKNDNFEQDPLNNNNNNNNKQKVLSTFLEKLKFSSSTCPWWSKITILSKSLGSGQYFWKNWNFHHRHVRSGQKSQFWIKSWIGPTFLENWNFHYRHVRSGLK